MFGVTDLLLQQTTVSILSARRALTSGLLTQGRGLFTFHHDNVLAYESSLRYSDGFVI